MVVKAPDPSSVFLQRHEFFVDMTCEGCSNAVTRVLHRLGGESSYRVCDDSGARHHCLVVLRFEQEAMWVTAGSVRVENSATKRSAFELLVADC